MCITLWWDPISIYNPIFFSFFDERKWVVWKYFTQESHHEAMFVFEATNEIQVPESYSGSN